MQDLPLRPTGLMERFNILRNHVKFYNNVQVAATYSVPRSFFHAFGNEGIEGLVYAALKETLNHQPILGVTVEDEGSKEPKWVRLETIDLREIVKVVKVDPNENPDKWVQEEHRVPLICLPELPLWRVVIAFQDFALKGSDSHVTFTLGIFGHHGIMDGLSGGAFHLTFLDALNFLIINPIALPSNANEAAIISVPKLPLVPNLEMKASMTLSIFFVLTQIFKAFIYNPVDKLNWSGPLVSKDSPRPPISNTRSFAFPASTVYKLVVKCRAEKTTVTALTTVLVARRWAVTYPEYQRFTATIPLSMRKFSGHSARDMGCYVSAANPYFSSEAQPPRGYLSCASSAPTDRKNPSAVDDEKMWESARATKRFIDEKTSTTHNQMVSLLKFVGDIKGYFLGLVGMKRQHAFEVTNIGVVDGGAGADNGKASFDRIVFSMGSCTYGDPYCILLATAKNGFMTVAVNWETGVIREEEAEDILGYLGVELARLAEA